MPMIEVFFTSIEWTRNTLASTNASRIARSINRWLLQCQWHWLSDVSAKRRKKRTRRWWWFPCIHSIIVAHPSSQSQTVNTGDRLTLICEIDSRIQKHFLGTVEWFHNGAPLKMNSHSRNRIDYRNGTLIIEKAMVRRGPRPGMSLTRTLVFFSFRDRIPECTSVCSTTEMAHNMILIIQSTFSVREIPLFIRSSLSLSNYLSSFGFFRCHIFSCLVPISVFSPWLFPVDACASLIFIFMFSSADIYHQITSIYSAARSRFDVNTPLLCWCLARTHITMDKKWKRSNWDRWHSITDLIE